MPLGEDVHSYSNFSEAVITHIYPHLTIDFQRQILFGYTDLTFEKLKDNVKSVRLDTKGLAIERVEDVKASDLPWTIPQTHAALGKCLEVDITTIKDKTFVIRIHYCTSKELSGGIQWFAPVQTLDKKHPFMYTQFEAILARTMIPCQDTPSVKAPYDIEITCPSPLVCACSGAQVGKAEPVKLFEGEWLKYTFQQKMPIPAYLIALACGGIQRQAIGTRCGVWAEPSLLQKAADEFSDTEEFLSTAAKIAGLPYEPLWGHYDLLVLPGAFPYGGMENPCLTFISSSLITGDKALVDVVAHEIAHSWSGNLVTNSGWPDFWINEGFTMYLERLILGEKHNEQLRHFHILLGYQDLQKTMSEFKDAPNFTKLVPDMEGIDPDDAFSRVPYEKGCSLLVHLEQLVGGKDKMTLWLRKYFSDFSKKSVTSTQVINHFESFFPGVKVDWNTWLHGTFMPAGFDPLSFLDTSLFNQCKALAEKWKAGGAGASADDIKWDSAMTMCFIDILINEEAKLTSDVLSKMNEAYKLSTTNNVELMIRWIMLNLQNENLDFIMPTLEDFVSKHGRGVYVKPIYSTLIRLSNSGKIPKDRVQTIYKRNRSFYHSVIRNSFDAQLN